jgi:hypothetical protein
MRALESLAWIVGSTSVFFVFVWMAVRLVRWAKRGGRTASLLGWSMGLPAAGANPIPPPQERIEEATREVQGRKSSDAVDPDD